MTTIPQTPQRGYRTIRLPLNEHEYERFTEDSVYARARLDALYLANPELFPASLLHGYQLNGFTADSIKQNLRCRRIRLKQSAEVFTIAPAFVMPYMSGRSEQVKHALFLMRFHVPCWAIAEVFGRDAMYWYRLSQGLGRFSLVATTVKQPELLPVHLVADEKHSWLKAKRIYLATTAAEGCFLGLSACASATQTDLQKGYGVFAQEAQTLKPDYEPHTINTDGWGPTQQAWKALFTQVTLILCFLHAFLKIRSRTTKAFGALGQALHDRVWHAYRAASKREFSQRLRRLKEWVDKVVAPSKMKDHTIDLCRKRDRFAPSYQHLHCHRTSNQVDRLMKFMDRACFNGQYFHGTLKSAEQRVRCWALLWNFCPSSPQTVKKYAGQKCPSERLNASRYAQCWLENLLISGSMNGTQSFQQNPL